MRVFVQVILISCLFNTHTTEGQEEKKTAQLYFMEFTVVNFDQNQACLEKSGGTQYYDLMTSECQSCESRENSHERYTLCPEYQLKKANTELEKADTELDKKLEKANKELEKANTEMEKKLELMELETRKQVASSNTLAIVAIVLAIVPIVLLIVIIAFVVRYYSRTLRPQDAKQNKIEESNNIEEYIKLLKTHREPSKDETSVLIAIEESSTEPYHIPKILDTCKLNDDEIRELFQKIQHSSSKTEWMKILMNQQQLENVSDVVATFPHFTSKLKLELDGEDDPQRFCRKLTEEINNFETLKLQTEELRMEVWDNFYGTILLKVVLRPGEPPQFTKFDIYGWNDDEIRNLLQTIQRSSTKTEEMEITMSPQLEHVSDVVATFPHFTRKLKLGLHGGDDKRRRRFCIELMEEITNFDTLKLQTQELNVEVRDGSTPTLLLEVVLRPGKPPHFIKFAIFEWNDEIRKLFQTIQHSSSKIEEMEINMNPQLKHVSDVVATFPHLTRKLKLKLGGGYDRPEFIRKLTEEINNFDTSKLQTKELKVEVWYVPSNNVPAITPLLEVVIRCGKPPQFIKNIFY